MRFKDYAAQQRGGLRGYLVKSKAVQHPGVRGSYHWYRDRDGMVVYGDRPLGEPRQPRGAVTKLGDAYYISQFPVEDAGQMTRWNHDDHVIYHGERGQYLLTPHGEVHAVGEHAPRYLGRATFDSPRSKAGTRIYWKVHDHHANILEGASLDSLPEGEAFPHNGKKMTDAQKDIADRADALLGRALLQSTSDDSPYTG